MIKAYFQEAISTTIKILLQRALHSSQLHLIKGAEKIVKALQKVPIYLNAEMFHFYQHALKENIEERKSNFPQNSLKFNL